MTRSTWIAVAVCAALGALIWKGETWMPRGAQPSYLFKLDPDRIVQLEVVRPEDQRWVLERGPSGWKMVRPKPYEVDALIADQFLANAARLEVDRKIADSAEELEGYGLAQPPWEIKVTLKDGSSSVIQIGRKTPDGRAFYVKRGETPAVYTARLWGAEALEKTVAEMRKKNLWTLPAGEAIRRVVVTGAGAARFDWEAAQGWKVNGQPADGQAVERMAWSLVELKASKFPEDEPRDLGKYGLRLPRRVIEIYGNDKKSLLAKVLVGKESGFGVYVKIEGQTPVYEVEQFSLKEVVKPAKEFFLKNTETKS